MAGFRRWVKRVLIGLSGLVVALVGLSAWLNRDFFERAEPAWTLARRDRVLLGEALHLRQELGDRVWPGWGQAELPIVAYNHEFVFLVGLDDPADGWLDPTGDAMHGGEWQPVRTDSFAGPAYYRQPMPTPDENPQSFTVRVGEKWAASLQTYSEMRIGLGERIRDALPGPLGRLFPYSLAVRTLTGGADGYVTLVCHEAFHAYQGTRAPERLRAAEIATADDGRYPGDQPELAEAWRSELDLLASALEAETDTAARELAQEFLEGRGRRRSEAGLDRELVEHERRREWLEGLAKYAEMRIWQAAAEDPEYRPLPRTAELPGFRDYGTFASRWSQELITLRNAASSGLDVRFYYSGMAQAFLLDRFASGWKADAFSDSVWLESLLASALANDDGRPGGGRSWLDEREAGR